MSDGRTFSDGLFAGVIGFVVMAASMAVLDLFAGRALGHTPSLLGQAVIGGFGTPTPGQVAAGPLLAYNGLSVLVFVAIGVLASVIVAQMELHPVLWYGGFFALLVAGLASFLVLALVSEPWTGDLSRWGIVLSNGLAAGAIGWFLHRAHPGLGARVKTMGDPEHPG